MHDVIKKIIAFIIATFSIYGLNERQLSTKYQDATPASKSSVRLNITWLIQDLSDVAKFVNKVEGYFKPINSFEPKKRNEVLVQVQAIRVLLKELRMFVNPTDAKLPPIPKSKVQTSEININSPTRNNSPLLRSPMNKNSSRLAHSFMSGTITPIKCLDRDSSPETEQKNSNMNIKPIDITLASVQGEEPKFKFDKIQIQNLKTKIEVLDKHNNYLKNKKKYFKQFTEQWKLGYPKFKQHLFDIYCKLQGIVNNGGIELTIKNMNREKIFTILQSMFTRLMKLWKDKRN